MSLSLYVLLVIRPREAFWFHCAKSGEVRLFRTRQECQEQKEYLEEVHEGGSYVFHVHRIGESVWESLRHGAAEVHVKTLERWFPTIADARALELEVLAEAADQLVQESGDVESSLAASIHQTVIEMRLWKDAHQVH